MTDQPYDGATLEQLRHPLVHEFLAVHDMFRSQLTAMLEYIDELTDGELPLTAPEATARTHALIRAGTQYTRMLHMHHDIETSAMFPSLQREGLEVAVVDRLNAEHDEIGVLIDRFSAAIQDLSAVAPEILDTDLRRLADALQAHLAYEETHVCPLLAHFSEWPLQGH